MGAKLYNNRISELDIKEKAFSFTYKKVRTVTEVIWFLKFTQFFLPYSLILRSITQKILVFRPFEKFSEEKAASS